jgi:hypothetical protein
MRSLPVFSASSARGGEGRVHEAGGEPRGYDPFFAKRVPSDADMIFSGTRALRTAFRYREAPLVDAFGAVRHANDSPVM